MGRSGLAGKGEAFSSPRGRVTPREGLTVLVVVVVIVVVLAVLVLVVLVVVLLLLALGRRLFGLLGLGNCRQIEGERAETGRNKWLASEKLAASATRVGARRGRLPAARIARSRARSAGRARAAGGALPTGGARPPLGRRQLRKAELKARRYAGRRVALTELGLLVIVLLVAGLDLLDDVLLLLLLVLPAGGGRECARGLGARDHQNSIRFDLKIACRRTEPGGAATHLGILFRLQVPAANRLRGLLSA